MEIQHQTFGSRGAFFVEQDGQVVAEMTYRRAGDDRMAIDHTTVAEELGGQGVGQQLVQAGVEFAREQGLKILPFCPFARSVIARTPEYQDVVD